MGSNRALKGVYLIRSTRIADLSKTGYPKDTSSMNSYCKSYPTYHPEDNKGYDSYGIKSGKVRLATTTYI